MQPNIETKDFILNTPDDWQDKSMQIWTAAPNPKYKVAPNVVTSTAKLPPNQSLSTFVNGQMKELMDVGSDVDIESRNQIQWHGHTTIELEFNWDNNGTLLKQRQLYVQKSQEDIISLVFTAGKADFEELRPLFQEMETQFQWKNTA